MRQSREHNGAQTGHPHAGVPDLARLCLPGALEDNDLVFAWMNSICLLFLLIGVFGRPASVYIAPPPVKEVIPVVVIPVEPPPPALQELDPDEPTPRAARLVPQVAVALDSPAVSFSVPTIGSLVVPVALSVAPPLCLVKTPAPMPVERISELANTGTGGERPQPPYPRSALDNQQQGTVVLALVASADGEFTNVTIKSSSGSRILDNSTSDFVRKRWSVASGENGRRFEATIHYRLILE